MKTTALTLEAAQKSLQIELIANGRGTQAVHETIVAYRAARRAGTHATKTKATVSYSGKKPWRQKGTGNARAGYKSSPVWSGGGVVFGPQPRDYSKILPKKVKKLALRKALSTRVQSGDVLLVDKFELKEPKTKALLKQLKGIEGSILLVLETPDKNVVLAARNHPALETTTGDQVNAEQLLQFDKVLVTEPALGKISSRLKE